MVRTSSRATCAFFLSIAAVAASTATAAVDPRFETPWPGVHLVAFDDRNVKSVVVEFETFLAVVELPGSDDEVRTLLATLREQIPGKPVRFAFHTHHHGHSLGAVDPLLASGVTLVTSPYNLDKARSLAADPAALESGTLLVRGTLTIADGMNALNVHVLSKGAYEVPTEEYLVVELPRTRAVVSGCLFNKPLDYWEVVNTRKTSLAAFLADRKIVPDWIVPTNTTRASGFEDVCRGEMLRETLEKGIRPEAIADRVQARSLEDLRAGLDALVEEFRVRTPRSYDLLVCASFLRTKREDPDRALVLLEVASRLFPGEAAPHEQAAECWKAKGETTRARESLERALALARTDEERKSLREQIASLSKEGG